jgi:hypothetical protein
VVFFAACADLARRARLVETRRVPPDEAHAVFQLGVETDYTIRADLDAVPEAGTVGDARRCINRHVLTIRPRPVIEIIATRSGRAAEFVYNHTNCPPMLLWLAEAAGVSKRDVLAAMRIALLARRNRGTHCAVIRRAIPWSIILG